MRKSTLEKIRAAYKKHEKIYKKVGYTEKLFIANIKSLMKSNGVRSSGAIKIFNHKEEFVSKTQVGAENIIKSLKALKLDDDDSGKRKRSSYDDFRKEVIGWRHKLNYKKFSYKQDIDNKERYFYTNNFGVTYRFILETGAVGSQSWTWEKVEDKDWEQIKAKRKKRKKNKKKENK